MSVALLSMIAADEGGRLGSMFVFFLIALVVVAPFGWVRIRRVLRERRVVLGTNADGGSVPGTAGADGTAPAAVIEPDPLDIVHAVDAIGAAGAALTDDAEAPEFVDVDVPTGALVGGRPAPDTLIDALLSDTARRIGLRLTWTDAVASDSRRARLTRR